MNKILVTLPNNNQINILDPDPELIDIETMAKNLSGINRFTGGCLYSVGQHSVNVYRYLKKYWPKDYPLQLAGLLHDGSEYITNDMISPIKKHLMIRVAPGKCIEFSKVENRITRAIEKKLDCVILDKALVKQADLDVGSEECRLLMPSRDYILDGQQYKNWWKIPEECDFKTWSAPKTEAIFLNVYRKLRRLINEDNLQKNNCQNFGATCGCSAN